MQKEGKIWGETFEILRTPWFSVHLIHGKEGYCCSEHFHKFMNNWFFVIKGKLLIRRWKENNIIDETILKKREQTIVPPNEYHQFVVLKDCIGLEIYWIHFPLVDIIRRTQGGKFYG